MGQDGHEGEASLEAGEFDGGGGLGVGGGDRRGDSHGAGEGVFVARMAVEPRGTQDAVVMSPRERDRLLRDLMLDDEDDRRLRANLREDYASRRQNARDHGRLVRQRLEQRVNRERQRSLEDSSDEAYSVAGCEEERDAERVAGDLLPDCQSPQGLRRQTRIDNRRRARQLEDEARTRAWEAEDNSMLSAHLDDVASMRDERRDGALAIDRARDRPDREHNDRERVSREEGFCSSSQDEGSDAARSTRVLCNRLESALMRARVRFDEPPDSNDEEGDLVLTMLPDPEPPAGDGGVEDVVGDDPLCDGNEAGLLPGGQQYRDAHDGGDGVARNCENAMTGRGRQFQTGEACADERAGGVRVATRGGEGGGGVTASDWVPVEFRDGSYIDRCLARAREDQDLLLAREQADDAMLLAFEQEDVTVVHRLTEEAVARAIRQSHEDSSDEAYSDSSDEG